MSNPIDDLIAGFQHLVGQVPELLQPLIIALAGAVPFIEGEGSAAIGVIGGLHPVVAAAAGILGNFLSVVLVVLLGSRIRTAAIAGRTRRATAVTATAQNGFANSETATAGTTTTEIEIEPAQTESKGRQRVRRWLVRFGVPGTSLLAPVAIPTHFTASMLVASGVSKGWVILWQGIAIVAWTVLITAVATGFLVAVRP